MTPEDRIAGIRERRDALDELLTRVDEKDYVLDSLDVYPLLNDVDTMLEGIGQLQARIQRLSLEFDALDMCDADGCHLTSAIFHCHGEDGLHGGECCTAPDIYLVQDNGIAVYRDHVPAALAAGLLAESRKLADVRALLADLVDAEPCDFDHHGYCQAHGWLAEGECPHARAKRVLTPAASSSPGTPNEGN